MHSSLGILISVAVSELDKSWLWLVVGFIGQALFGLRFIIQWIVSEAKKESTVPIVFWYFSLAGGATLLSYAIYKLDPVFIAGQAGELLIYIRNLILIYRKREATKADT
ncbi:MAG: lipid-A-disaccharide synthase N-terminal domain-containing protein [Myxococcota bacterium]